MMSHFRAELREKFDTGKDFLLGSFRTFRQIKGAEKSASFAFYGFFSFFPFLALLISIGSYFFSIEKLSSIIYEAADFFLPTNSAFEMNVLNVVKSFAASRSHLGVFAFILLLWGAMRFLNTLIAGINHAWGLGRSQWWLRSLKNLSILGLLALALLASLIVPVMLNTLKRFLVSFDIHLASLDLIENSILWEIIPYIVLYLGVLLLLFLSPPKKIRLSHIWREAMLVVFLLKITQNFFSYFIVQFSSINLLYGAFGEIISLLLWLYLSGIYMIYGACLCASHYRLEEPKHYL